MMQFIYEFDLSFFLIALVLDGFIGIYWSNEIHSSRYQIFLPLEKKVSEV